MCNRIEHWLHLRCAGIRQSQYTYIWTCHLHRESGLTLTQIYHYPTPPDPCLIPLHTPHTTATHTQTHDQHFPCSHRIGKPEPNPLFHSPPSPHSQVNINGIKNQLEELKLLIHDTHADIITIQEAKFTPKANTPKVHKFTTTRLRDDRLHNAGGGLIILITFPTTDIPLTINTHNFKW